STQVLPGDRALRLDLKGHQPVDEIAFIPARGSTMVERTLAKVAARLAVTASPAGASIFIDGQLAGKDRIDRGVLPGAHTLRITAEGHKDFEQRIEVRPDEQMTVSHALEAIAPPPNKNPQVVVIRERDPSNPNATVVTG